MRFIITSCWHIGAKYGDTREGFDIVEVLAEFINHVQRAKPHVVIILGDIFQDFQPQMRDLHVALGMLHALDGICEVRVIAGNQDCPGFWWNGDLEQTGIGQIKATPFKRVRVIDEPEIERWHGGPIVGYVPWLPRVYDKRNEIKAQTVIDRAIPAAIESGVRVFLGHLNVKGAVEGYEDEHEKRTWPRRLYWPLESIKNENCTIWNGHYHRAQTMKVNDTEIVMPGYIDALDADGHGYAVVEM